MKISIKDNKLLNYIKSSRDELKKVTWPTKKEATKYSLIVIGMSLAIAVFFGILDFIFTLGLEAIIQ